MPTDISLIICSRNRSPALSQTLLAIGQLDVPSHCRVELIVVDNASTDSTAQVIQSFRPTHMAYRPIHESRKGQCYARNAALAASSGQLLLFTDDDVRPDRCWIDQLSRPIIDRRCEATVGKISLAPHLVRQWMTPLHRRWLAAPDEPRPSEVELIGANMAFHRHVLARVPAFDTDLGPGGLGFGDDTLFSFQLQEAGDSISYVQQAGVVHHLNASRLLRKSWLKAARARGRTQAYLGHHWHHNRPPNTKFAFILLAKLLGRRLLQRPPNRNMEGCQPWEISYVAQISMLRQWKIESKRPPNYHCRGLVKRTSNH